MPERVLNWIALSNSTAGKCILIQVIKQPEHAYHGIVLVCFSNLPGQVLKVKCFYICVYAQVSIASLLVIYEIIYVYM